MAKNFRRPDMGAVLSIIIILVLLCYFAAFAVINFVGFEHFCTTDMYEDTLVARLIWEQKSLFPESYLFGNQFYVIATPVLAALFYGICGSMNLAMGLATTVMSVLILLALNWMLRPFVKEAYVRYAALLALVAGVYGPNTVIREDGQLFFVMCSFYACYLISFFVLLGDYARARESEKLRLPAFILALFLSFCTGMQSLRQTCVSMLPILCFECLAALTRLIKKQPLFPMDKRMSLIRALSYLIANLAGVVFIKLLGVGRNEIYYGQSIFNGASIRDKFKAMHEALITVSGFDFTRSGNGAFFIVLFLFFSLISFAAFCIIIKNRAKSKACVSFWIICIIAVAAVIAASFVTSVSLRPIYLFPLYALPALSLPIVSQRLKSGFRSALCSMLCVLAFCNIYYSYHNQLEYALNPEKSDFEQISDYAVENGYELVYGSHSHTAPYVAVHSDGKLIAGCWDDEILFKISPYINIRDIYGIEDYKRAIFVFTEFEQPYALNEAAGNGTVFELQAKIGDYYLYTSSAQMLYPRTEALLSMPDRFPEYN